MVLLISHHVPRLLLDLRSLHLVKLTPCGPLIFASSGLKQHAILPPKVNQGPRRLREQPHALRGLPARSECIAFLPVPLIEPRDVVAILLDNAIHGISIPILEIARAPPCGFEAAHHRCLAVVKRRLADGIDPHLAKGNEDLVALLGGVGVLSVETLVAAAGEDGDDGGEKGILDDGNVLAGQKTVNDRLGIGLWRVKVDYLDLIDVDGRPRKQGLVHPITGWRRISEKNDRTSFKSGRQLADGSSA
jgi:hypothetical protein